MIISSAICALWIPRFNGFRQINGGVSKMVSAAAACLCLMQLYISGLLPGAGYVAALPNLTGKVALGRKRNGTLPPPPLSGRAGMFWPNAFPQLAAPQRGNATDSWKCPSPSPRQPLLQLSQDVQLTKHFLLSACNNVSLIICQVKLPTAPLRPVQCHLLSLLKA